MNFVDYEEKKRFIMGLVFTLIAIGGAITISVGFLLRVTSARLMESSIVSSLFMIPYYQQFGIGWEQFLLYSLLSSLSRYTRMVNFSTFVTYIGISICVPCGILGAIGWKRFYNAKYGKI